MSQWLVPFQTKRVLVAFGCVHANQVAFGIAICVSGNSRAHSLAFVAITSGDHCECRLVLSMVLAAGSIWGNALPGDGALIPWPCKLFVPELKLKNHISASTSQ